MSDESKGGLSQSPKDPVKDRVEPRGGPLERAGTEAERDAQGERAPPEPGGVPAGGRNTAHRGSDLAAPGEEAGRDVERAAAYRENDA